MLSCANARGPDPCPKLAQTGGDSFQDALCENGLTRAISISPSVWDAIHLRKLRSTTILRLLIGGHPPIGRGHAPVGSFEASKEAATTLRPDEPPRPGYAALGSPGSRTWVARPPKKVALPLRRDEPHRPKIVALPLRPNEPHRPKIVAITLRHDASRPRSSATRRWLTATP